MLINPGGEVPAFGREAFIRARWQALELRSFQLLGERRTGKTTVVKAMCQRPVTGFLAVYRDIAGLTSAAEFVERLVNDLNEHLPLDQHLRNELRAFWKGLGGTEIGGILKLPASRPDDWKRVLEETLALLDAKLPADTRFVFFWDEVPLMLRSIVARDHAEAVALLNTLRSIRHRPQSRLRMVYTGSIGLHHVLTELREMGTGNNPVNDLEPIELPPLDPLDAARLATELLDSVGALYDASVPAHIAQQCQGLPYLVQFVCSRLRDALLGPVARITDADVDTALESLIRDPADPLDLRHFVLRLADYYGGRREIAVAILDALAVDAPLTFVDLHNRVRHRLPDATRDEVLLTVSHLQQDHYLREPEQGQLAFLHDVLRRAWRHLRRLE